MDYGMTRALGDVALMYAIVVVVSLLVAVVIRLIVMTLSRRAGETARTTPIPARPALAAGVPPEHVAAIAAAVALVTGSHRIVHIEPAPSGQSWTAVTRVTHHTSHAPRKG